MLSKLKSILNRLCKIEHINGDGLCSTYLYRWTLLSTRNSRVYLHHFVGSDWAMDPHDHPKNFISIGLAGEYTELDFNADLERPRAIVWRAPWIRRFPATHRHRLVLKPGASVWTICIVGRRIREWGFWYQFAHWVPWNEYVWGGAGAERKDC